MATRSIKGAFYCNIGDKNLPIGKKSLKQIKKAFISEAGEDLRKQYLEKNKLYNKEKYTVVLESKGFKQPKISKSNQNISEKRLERLDLNTRKIKYFLISLVFYRLIARTPVDESYWTYEKDSSKKTFELEDIYYYTTDKKTGEKKLKKRSERSIYEHENGIRRKYHKADDRKIRNEWYLKIGNSRKTYNTKDFKLDYDNAFEEGVPNTNLAEIDTIADKLGKASKYPDFEEYEIWNTSPYFRTLEFGEYLDDRSLNDKEFIGKGKKRFHGTHKGYSVQAPLGLLGRTLAEFSELERLTLKKGKDEIDESKRYGKKNMANFSLSSESDVENKYKPRYQSAKVIGKTEEITSFYLEDLINNVCENKHNVKLYKFEAPAKTQDELYEEFEAAKLQRKNKRHYEKEKAIIESIKKRNKKYKNYTIRDIRKTDAYLSEVKGLKNKKEYKIIGNICDEVRETNLSLIENYVNSLRKQSYTIDVGDYSLDDALSDIAYVNVLKQDGKTEIIVYDMNENSMSINEFERKYKKKVGKKILDILSQAVKSKDRGI